MSCIRYINAILTLGSALDRTIDLNYDNYTHGGTTAFRIEEFFSSLTWTVPNNLPAWCLYHPGISWGTFQLPLLNDSRLMGIRQCSNISKSAQPCSTFKFPYNSSYVALALFILLFSYLTRVSLLLFDSSFGVLKMIAQSLWVSQVVHLINWLGISRMKTTEAEMAKMGSPWIRFRLLRSFYMLYIACKELYTSIIWEVGQLTQPSMHFANTLS